MSYILCDTQQDAYYKDIVVFKEAFWVKFRDVLPDMICAFNLGIKRLFEESAISAEPG
jgi:hypothetical protein